MRVLAVLLKFVVYGLNSIIIFALVAYLYGAFVTTIPERRESYLLGCLPYATLLIFVDSAYFGGRYLMRKKRRKEVPNASR